MLEEMIGEKHSSSVVKFVSDVKNGKTVGSFNIANHTISLLKDLISEVKFDNSEELMDKIKHVGKQLCTELPQEAVVGNMVRRILRIIREELLAAGKVLSGGAGESLQGLLMANEEASSIHRQELPAFRIAVLDHITEFQMELDTCGENITSQATEHIHSNEIILTLGSSRLVEMFLRKAAIQRKFQVLVAEGAPNGDGHKTAVNLAKNKIETTFIADSAIFAVMSRVNKVIIGTQTVLAGGGLRATAGIHSVALAAKHYSVPVIVLCPLYKLCPEHLCSYEQENFNTLVSPEGALPYSNGSLVHRTNAYCPLYDYVPPDLVTLFITNLGGNAPSYIYRLLSELYHPDDYDL